MMMMARQVIDDGKRQAGSILQWTPERRVPTSSQTPPTANAMSVAVGMAQPRSNGRIAEIKETIDGSGKNQPAQRPERRQHRLLP